MSSATKHLINLQEHFDIELSILSKNAVIDTFEQPSLPTYLTRDEHGTLRSTSSGRRAFSGIGKADTIDAHG